MINENGTTDIKVQIEGLRKDVESVNHLNSRLDTAIEKLTDVSTSIKSMLAVHEEKINRQEQIDEIIFDKLKERANEIDMLQQHFKQEMASVERRLLNEIKSIKLDIGARVGILEKYRWIIMGGAIVVGFILSKNFATILQMMS